MIGPADESDGTEIAAIYRRNHPGEQGHLEPRARCTQQTLVARDHDGHIMGIALVIFMDCSVAPYRNHPPT